MPLNRLSPKPHGIAEIKLVGTNDLDEATSMLRAVYGAESHLDILDSKDEFRMDLVSTAFGDVRLTRAKIANWSMTRATGECAHIALPLDGALLYDSGARRLVAEPSKNAAVGRPFETVNLKVTRGKGLALDAPIDALIERAERLTGESYDRSLIDGMVHLLDLSSPICEALARTMKAAMLDTVSLASLGLGGLALAGYEDLLLNMATTALFPRVAADYGHAPPDCDSAIIRRARDYIDAHAAEVIELSALAKKLGVSMRAMQSGFQRYYGYSPRDFIIECRLERAHKKLLAGERSGSVTEIALDCGFSDLSHFSAKYRDKYGKAPSETLRAAMK
jgi:AraC-like DNA-binding protein